MGLFDWLRRRRPNDANSQADHAVLIVIPRPTANEDELALDEIEDPLYEAIEQAGVGEFDGNEIGPDGATLYMYGPDADALWGAIESALRALHTPAGTYAIKRYGAPGAKEVRIAL